MTFSSTLICVIPEYLPTHDYIIYRHVMTPLLPPPSLSKYISCIYGNHTLKVYINIWQHNLLLTYVYLLYRVTIVTIPASIQVKPHRMIWASTIIIATYIN